MEPFDFGSVLDATGARPVCGDRSLVFRSVSTDSRTTPPGSLFVALRGPRFDGNDHAADALRRGAVGVFVSPGRAPDLAHPQACAEHADPAAALLALAAWHRRRFRVPVIGITGSCGKTTTKDLTAACLRRLGPTVASEKSFNNDVGVPATLLRLDRETRSAVVEIGTSGPGEIARLSAIAAPTIGVITNIAEAHLEGLGTIEGVAREKGDLLEALPEDGVAILNADDRFFPALARRAGRRRVVRFALETEAEYTARDIVFHVAGASFTVQGRAATIPLLGSHVVADALAAIAAAVEAGLSLDAALAALAQIPPPERRLERKRFGEVEVLDDCYNANPASVRAAIRALAGLRLGRR
ncbi:MAG TPA: UDP-N-acetylmuramoyl-tripeptide--D-alanyl-D-alanine ligase, partial [Planctomycetota bacterium]|nr:UDP-N-acetylmuramoyl-tripeptide--D-alanyl-D-alanine ligase [Planctomycetota bacterium]